MNIKFATWNMAHWSHKEHDKESWNYFVNSIDSDVLLFQESYPNLDILNPSQVVWNAIGGTRPWGSGIYSSKFPVKELSFKTEFFGSIVATEITVKKDLKLIVISLYGLMEKISNVVYSIPNLHRMLSDLTGILESRDTKHRIILGGDFNASLQIDEQQTGNSHKVLFDRLSEFGLVNCFTNYFEDFIQTHRHSKSKKPWQNDYFFISKKLEKKLVNCQVLDNENVRKYSDHNPVIIELDL